MAWEGRSYNAIPVDEYPCQEQKEDYCLFLGRMSPEKVPDLAIKAAREAGYRIVVAARCNEPPEKRYFVPAARLRLLRRGGHGGGLRDHLPADDRAGRKLRTRLTRRVSGYPQPRHAGRRPSGRRAIMRVA
jgi:glycosyltransferase involved in cell wall biosynthesis